MEMTARKTETWPRPKLYHSILFFALVSGPPRLRTRDPGASLAGEVDAVILLTLGVWLAGAAWLFVQVIRRGTIPRLSSIQFLAIAFLYVLAMSALVSPGVLLTLFTVFQYVVMVFFALFFVRTFGTETFLTHLYYGYMVMGFLILLAAVVAPDMVFSGGEWRLRGDLIGPTGFIAALGLTLLVAGVPRLSRLMFWVCLVMLLLLLLASVTRTAYIAVAAIFMMGWVLFRPLPIRRLLPLAALGFAIIVIFDLAPTVVDFLTREKAGLATLSARIPLWEMSLDAMWERSPVIGLGYYAASRVLQLGNNPALGTSHSAYIEVLVGSGVLGGLFFILLLIAMGLMAARLLLLHLRERKVFAAVGLFIVVVITSITTTQGIHTGPIGFTFWSLTALLPYLLQELNATKAGVLGGDGNLDSTVNRGRPPR